MYQNTSNRDTDTMMHFVEQHGLQKVGVEDIEKLGSETFTASVGSLSSSDDKNMYDTVLQEAIKCQKDLEKFPRVSLGHLPTPLEYCPRLSKALGGVDIYVKRDDCTGLATGGNKTRKLGKHGCSHFQYN